MTFDQSLPDDQIARRARAWTREHLPNEWRTAAEAGRWDEVAHLAADPAVAGSWYREMGDAGLASPTWPTAYGGLALTTDQAAIVAEELARYRAGRPISDFVGLALAGPTILAWGTAEQKESFLRPLARGEHRWCQLFSEPGAGSDLAALETRAERRDDGRWVVNGQKVWSSFADISEMGLLLARTNVDVPKHHGITYFLLPMRTPGVEVRPMRQMTGEAEFNEVFLDDVVVEDAARLGPVDEGWRVAMFTLAQERSGLGGRPTVGDGRVDELIDRARQTGAWNDPRRRDRLVAAFVEERALQMATVRSYVYDPGGSPGAEGSVRKLANAVLEERLGHLGLEIEPDGGVAWDGPSSVAAHRYLAMKTSAIAGGTSEIQRNIIAERLLGLPKDEDPYRARPFRDRGRR